MRFARAAPAAEMACRLYRLFLQSSTSKSIALHLEFPGVTYAGQRFRKERAAHGGANHRRGRGLAGAEASVESKAEFLTALARRGETVAEIAGFARALRQRAVEPPIDAATRARQILDVCGTGGDRLNTFNISTTVALVVASSGTPVAKHGNRAITSQAGSADVLEALGHKNRFDPEEAARSLRDHDFAFFFAPQLSSRFQADRPGAAALRRARPKNHF